VGKSWVRNFLDRHTELTSKCCGKYDHQRVQCEDPDIFRKWFKHVHETITDNGIVAEDIDDFEETGIQMGVIATAKVVTASERAGRPVYAQPGNREQVIVVEAINLFGWALPQ